MIQKILLWAIATLLSLLLAIGAWWCSGVSSSLDSLKLTVKELQDTAQFYHGADWKAQPRAARATAARRSRDLPAP